MCGFFVTFNSNSTFSFNEKEKAYFAESIRYRGRDEEGFWADNYIQMGHSRLSIIDLEEGSQPMIDSTGRYVIVFNGEIYNYLELARDYKKLGANFLTKSDTEVILEGFKLKKEKVLQDLNGMFSFIIYDKKEKTIFISRDQLGKKPLFWTKFKDIYIFSSTIKTFDDFIKKEVNNEYIKEVNTFGASISNYTIWKKVYEFTPGAFSLLKDNNDIIQEYKYSKIDFSKKSQLSFKEQLEKYEEILIDAIKLRLRADVPLCLTFSGGVDSGTIAAIISKKLNQNPKLFCIDYDMENDRSSEVAQANSVAEKLGLKLNFINYNFKEKMLNDFRDGYKNFGQPCLQFPLVYSGVLYKEIHQSAKVTLSGNGADEIFTGYNGDQNNYYKNIIYNFLYPLTKRISIPKVPRALDVGIIESYIEYQLGERFSFAAKKLRKELQEASVNDYYDLQMYMSLVYGASDANFVLPDVCGLSNQVEVRSPFLDYRLIQFAAELPLKYKIKRTGLNSFVLKYLMREYYKKYVGHELAYAPKRGMSYNISWHKEIKNKGEFYNAILNSLNVISNWKISNFLFKDALKTYMNNREYDPKNCSDLMQGLMLGAWLQAVER